MSVSRRVVVRLPAKDFTFEESVDILKEILGRGGCGGCYSGLDISFINEVEFVVNEAGAVRQGGAFAE